MIDRGVGTSLEYVAAGLVLAEVAILAHAFERTGNLVERVHPVDGEL